MLERWFLKRLGGVRAVNLVGSHESRVLLPDTEGGGEGIFHLPGKNMGMPVEDIQVLPKST
jgi:hypothetical protein